MVNLFGKHQYDATCQGKEKTFEKLKMFEKLKVDAKPFDLRSPKANEKLLI